MKRYTKQILSQMSFYEICEASIEGSDAAWDYLCSVVWRRAEKIALLRYTSFGLTSEDARDAAQSCIELFTRKGRALLKKSQANGLTGAWLQKFVRDAVISFFRKLRNNPILSRTYHLADSVDLFDKCNDLETGSREIETGERYSRLRGPALERDECEVMESIVTARILRDVMVKTDEERKIADALSAGMTYRQIASIFDISVNSVHRMVCTMRGRVARFMDNHPTAIEMAA